MIQCEGQLSLMDLFAPVANEFKPGDWIEKENVGEQLTFDQITQMVNQLIVMVENNTQRRLVYYDGGKQRGMVNEMYFDETMRFPARAYRLKG